MRKSCGRARARSGWLSESTGLALSTLALSPPATTDEPDPSDSKAPTSATDINADSFTRFITDSLGGGTFRKFSVRLSQAIAPIGRRQRFANAVNALEIPPNCPA